MASGICIFAENFNLSIDSSVAELVFAAHSIKEKTGEPIQVMLVANNCQSLIKQLEALAVDEIYAVETTENCLFKDDAMSQVVSEMLGQIKPSSVLVPATVVGRSLFSRVAARMGCGLTADCTDLAVMPREDGSFYIKQNKPSFGENIMVSIITREDCYPQMMTIRPGVYSPHVKSTGKMPKVQMLAVAIPDSGIKIIESLPSKNNLDSLVSAEVVVVGGRGALEKENLELLQKFADKIGAAVAGTRPMVDTEVIPFENQIGQTGCTIRPKICVSLGVSGAIQHTEGIKDTKLFIAINTDKDAPIFNLADYGIVADMKEILKCAVK